MMPVKSAFPRRMILCAIFLCLCRLSVSSPRSLYAGMMQASNCSDSMKACRKPVKFISRDGTCYTFACEYGAPAQHNIHVQNRADIEGLLQMARESNTEPAR